MDFGRGMGDGMEFRFVGGNNRTGGSQSSKKARGGIPFIERKGDEIKFDTSGFVETNGDEFKPDIEI